MWALFQSKLKQRPNTREVTIFCCCEFFSLNSFPSAPPFTSSFEQNNKNNDDNNNDNNNNNNNNDNNNIKFQSMTVTQLKERLKEHHLPVKGNKPELVQRLLDTLKSETAANEVKLEAVHSNNPVSKASEANKVDSAPPATIATAATTATIPSNGTEVHKEEPADNSHEDVDADKPIQESPVGKKKTNNQVFFVFFERTKKKLAGGFACVGNGCAKRRKKKKAGAKAEAISQNLGVTTAELILKRQERIKRYGLQSMPEQTKRMLRKQRFLKSRADEYKDKNRSSDNDNDNDGGDDTNANGESATSDNANGNKAENQNPNEIHDTKNIKTEKSDDFNDFSVESLFGENEVSKGLTGEILSARRKRFGDKAIADAFQQSKQKTFQNRERDRDRDRDRDRNRNFDRIRNRNRNGNRSRNGNNNYADNRNRSFRISSNTQRHNRGHFSSPRQHDRHRRNADDIVWADVDQNKFWKKIIKQTNKQTKKIATIINFT
ncbi:hypothetical protein RFI_15290 [Reticulomyxa filosa]|uniref:SAP domain-containing protein n=1 Tax=Reticulomyxa filosa TaxID=46433 RepID=X6N7P7_RETFI|nr:hypothetical protein RFI_15290 [Reticulomyxa filosa]|eukprot:ETO21913.1 hypothetical protein RFI_15290 [Reticulomyxa filosa]